MNPTLYWLCTQTAYLNRIPRYGRSFRIQTRVVTQAEFEAQRGEPGFWGPPEWSWRRNGEWGTAALNLVGLKDQYWNEYDRRHGHS